MGGFASGIDPSLRRCWWSQGLEGLSVIDLFVEGVRKDVEPPKRLVGHADSTGEELPMCRPATHKEDGTHSVLCIAGILGYRQAEDGLWDRIPPDELTVPGAMWEYRGHAYVRPVGRGVHLDEGARYQYLEDLPEGDYEVQVKFVRQSPEEPA